VRQSRVCWKLAFLLVVVPFSVATPAYEVLDPWKGLPDYDKAPPFTGRDPAAISALREAVRTAHPSGHECPAGSVRVWADWTIKLQSNVCDAQLTTTLRNQIGALAPSLDRSRLSFWITSLDGAGTPALLVEYIVLNGEKVAPYPFLAIWRIRFDADSYQTAYAGGFLNGRIHTVRTFGEQPGRRIVFVEHLSCLECEPTTYVTAIAFDGPTARPFEFSYSEDHHDYGATVEYALPGMGHTVDAAVETRTLPPSSSGPHLLQSFRMEPGEGPDEWWSFTCKRYRCDYKLEKGAPSPDFQRVWNQAGKL
jgi:hypothetical protein